MDPNLHQKQGIAHLTKVLNYAPFVAQDGRATVHLTPEDWHVVADTLFAMQTPRELLPPDLQDYALAEGTIRLKTAEYEIDVDKL